MACAVIEAVIDIIESEGLLANVRRCRSVYPRRPASSGRSPASRARDSCSACDHAVPRRTCRRELLERRHPHRHQRRSARPAPPARRTCSTKRTSTRCATTAALPAGAATPSIMKRFLDLADFPREQVVDLLDARAAPAGHTRSRARSRARSSACCSSIRRCARWRRSRPAWCVSAASRSSITPGPGHVAARDAPGRDHERRAPPSMCAKASRCSPRTATRSASAAFADGKDLAGGPDRVAVPDDGGRSATSRSINMESADQPSVPGARRLEDDGRARRAARRQVRAELGLSPARAAARGAGRDACTWPRCAAWTSSCCGRKGYRAAGARSWRRRSAAAAASGGTVTETTDRSAALNGAHVVYAKEWGSPAHYGDAEAESRLRAAARRLVRAGELVRATRAPDCHFMHCLPVRRNVAVADEVLDGPRSRVKREAANRMVGADGRAPSNAARR